ncbi:MAG: transglutaminase domain-containing protein [Coriobacteriales bacterium]|jgi:hypothetical protein|nr:transglutaminase domain-containing protein [Coriobacteriales bacterium]
MTKPVIGNHLVRMVRVGVAACLASMLVSCAPPADSADPAIEPSPSAQSPGETPTTPFYVVDTGDAALDAHLTKALETFDPQVDLLWQCFAFAAHTFAYEDGPENPEGAWTVPFAADMFADGAGNCMQFAAVFALLAQSCGFDAQAVVGEVLTNDKGWSLHGWVEVRQDDALYLCDPTMENGLLRGGNWYMVGYAQAEASYRLDGQPCADISHDDISNGDASSTASPAAAYDHLLDLAVSDQTAQLLLHNDSGLTITGLGLTAPADEDFPTLVPASGLALAPGQTLLLRYDLPPATPAWTNIVLCEYRELQVSFDGTSAYLLHDLDLTVLDEASLGFAEGVAYLAYEDFCVRSRTLGLAGRLSTLNAEQARLYAAQEDALQEGSGSAGAFDQDSDACLDDPTIR